MPKYRTSFVTNSSSSSFICDACGETYSGMDLCPSDIGGGCCEDYEHQWCSCIGDDINECPICSMSTYAGSDMCRYLYKIYGISRDEVFTLIKAQNKRRRKLYDYEYIAHVFTLHNLTEAVVMDEIRSKFKTYDEFFKFL